MPPAAVVAAPPEFHKICCKGSFVALGRDFPQTQGLGVTTRVLVPRGHFMSTAPQARQWPSAFRTALPAGVS